MRNTFRLAAAWMACAVLTDGTRITRGAGRHFTTAVGGGTARAGGFGRPDSNGAQPHGDQQGAWPRADRPLVTVRYPHRRGAGPACDRWERNPARPRGTERQLDGGLSARRAGWRTEFGDLSENGPGRRFPRSHRWVQRRTELGDRPVESRRQSPREPRGRYRTLLGSGCGNPTLGTDRVSSAPSVSTMSSVHSRSAAARPSRSHSR